MTQDPWKPEQYERFRAERSRPFFDLLALVHPAPAMRVVDLGCGTGELTRRLHRQMNATETIGVDNSAAMLQRSADHAGGGLRFENGDIESWMPDRSFDLVFSNGALHWVADHEALLSRLTRAVAENGQIAVQMPANHDHPSHLAAAEVAAESPFAEELKGFVHPTHVRPPEFYSALLDRLGYRDQHVRLQVYGHRLASRDDVVEWVKGTTLTAYQRKLSATLMSAFLERYRERLFRRLPDQKPFFFTFKRIFFWALR